MAVDEKGLRSKIELKFKGKSITKNFKDNLAKKWAPKIETEDDVDGYIDDREDIILETAAESDRIRTELSRKPKPPTTPEDDDAPDDEPKTEMQKLMAEVAKLAGVVTGFQQERVKSTVRETAGKHDLIKDVPKSYLKGYSYPDKEEDIETWAQGVADNYKEFATEMKIETQGSNETPLFGGLQEPAASGKPGKVDPAIKAFADTLTPKK